jgi:signal transduction histidine kinase
VERLRAIAERPDWPVISGLALAMVALLEAYVYSRLGSSYDVPTTFVLALGQTLPLMVRRTRLRTAVTLTTLATVLLVMSADATPETVAGIAAQAWVLFLAAERYRGRVVLALGVLLALIMLSNGDPGLSNVLTLAAGIAALGIGSTRRLGGQVEEAQRDQAVLEERARIARELHDVVAHHVSTIAIQADTARLTTPGLPPAGAEQLEAIGYTARDAMTEMRRVLGVLRTQPGELAPQPGLEGLGELLEAARNAGTPVRLVLDGRVAPLAPGVDLTAYRIVQEALTNARRHAPGATVEVELHYGADALRLRVRDDGPGPAPGADGHGLIGMRERVATVGGSLATGPADGGGFLVDATLPL